MLSMNKCLIWEDHFHMFHKLIHVIRQVNPEQRPFYVAVLCVCFNA